MTGLLNSHDEQVRPVMDNCMPALGCCLVVTPPSRQYADECARRNSYSARKHPAGHEER